MLPEESLTALIPLGLLILVGLALWAAGRRLMRPAFAVGGLVVGYLIGYGLATAASLQLGDWVVGSAVGLVAASLAILVYRLAVTLVLAAVLAVAAPITVLTVAEFRGDVDALLAPHLATEDTPETVPDTPEADDPADWLRAEDADDVEPAPGGGVLAMPELRLSGLPDETAEQLARAGTWLERMAEAVSRQWHEAPEPLRPTILISAVCGALAGVILGTASLALSSAIVSSFGGSLVMLVGGRAGIELLGDGLERLVPASMSVMLLVWLILAVVGLGIQWTLRPGPADKAA